MDENCVLQERLTVMQKRATEAESGLDDCQVLMTEQGINCNKQVLVCERNTEENIRKHCGGLCASCYLLVQDVKQDLTGILGRGHPISAEATP